MNDQDLTDRRREAADLAFEGYDFGYEVVDGSGWEHDSFSNEWIRPVFFQDDENPYGDSVKGAFTVRFDQGSDAVSECWGTVKGEIVGTPGSPAPAPR